VTFLSALAVYLRYVAYTSVDFYYAYRSLLACAAALVNIGIKFQGRFHKLNRKEFRKQRRSTNN